MGRVFRPTYTAPTKEGPRVKGMSPNWHMEYKDAAGRLVRRMVGRTKAEAQDTLSQAEAEVRAIKNGVPIQDGATMLCASLVEDYLRSLKPRVCPGYLENTQRQLAAATAGINAVFVRDLSADAMEGFLAQLDDKGLCARSVNGYLVAIRGCLNWAMRRRKIAFNPLSCLQKRRETEKVRRRRPLAPEECARLLEAAQAGPLRRARGIYHGQEVPAEDRRRYEELGRRNRLIYAVLLQTGLRVNELRSLTWEDLDLEKGILHVRATWSKNRKAADLPLSPGALEMLREWRAGRLGQAATPVVEVPRSLLRTFYDDLRAAGIQRVDESGRSVDLHALRHTFGQLLNAAGVDPKTLQTLMRHSTPSLTLGIYLHADQERMARAVEGLPGMEDKVVRETGT